MRLIDCWLLVREACCLTWAFAWRYCLSRRRDRLVFLLRLLRRRLGRCRINPGQLVNHLLLFVRYALLLLSISRPKDWNTNNQTGRSRHPRRPRHIAPNILSRKRRPQRKGSSPFPSHPPTHLPLTPITVPPRPPPNRAKRQKIHNHLRQPHLDRKPPRTLAPLPRPPRDFSAFRPPPTRTHQQPRPLPRRRRSHPRLHRCRRPRSGYP